MNENVEMKESGSKVDVVINLDEKDVNISSKRSVYSDSDDGNINRAILEKIIHVSNIGFMLNEQYNSESSVTVDIKMNQSDMKSESSYSFTKQKKLKIEKDKSTRLNVRQPR